MIEARRFRIEGQVQGVGFRPFLARLADELGLAGETANVGGRVEGVVEGEADWLDAFMIRLRLEAPAGAHILAIHDTAEAIRGRRGFHILPSLSADAAEHHLPLDRPPCSSCLTELADARDRRHRHPFIACAACGPRVSLLESPPWDRGRTGMAGFALCPDCLREYRDPADRRFHAEAIACPSCGPRLWFVRGAGRIDGDQAALKAAVAVLRDGGIVAVKGVGGYQLMCDARNEAAVRRLRERKHRPTKPLAVMFPWAGADGLVAVRRDFGLGAVEAEALVSSARPIVLLSCSRPHPLPDAIAPGLTEIGIMLPSSPLHHLLLDDFASPLVATSGNRSGEPLASTPDEAEARLVDIADAFLHHDRPILHPMDDPVRRVIAGRARPLRLGRGDAPLELDLPFALKKTWLAVGGQMKNAVALGWGRRAVLSPHIGDLEGPRAHERFEASVEAVQGLYGRAAEAIAHDLHPGYASTRWARRQTLPTVAVQHHAAHASALYAEAWMEAGAPPDEMLVLTWDGLGYGSDGGLWGGEALLGRPGQWRRVASLRPFRLPGGERAAREPWRSALGMTWAAGLEGVGVAPEGIDLPLLRQAAMQNLNAPFTTSMGRLFDGAAALLGLCLVASYEGEAAMRLEAAASSLNPSPGGRGEGVRGDGKAALPGSIPLAWREDGQGLLHLDWTTLLPMLLDASRPVVERAAVFHASLARAALDLVSRLGEPALGLTGGVMQNRLLVELIQAEAASRAIEVCLPARVPVNDAGLAFGQLVEAHFMERMQ
ncbi:MAG: carbamoyltransferase HypF [Pseudomonadota bacterium]